METPTAAAESIHGGCLAARGSPILNANILGRFRDQMRPFYYDAARFPTYLDQLVVQYPTLRGADGSCGAKAVP